MSLRAALGVTAGDGDFFDQLLMPPLDGALALAQNLDVAVLVGQHLKLDMPRRSMNFSR